VVTAVSSAAGTDVAGNPTAEPASAAAGCALPPGTRLGEFEVERVLGAGGFGIVYLALDHSLGRRVAIKEYVPSSLAVRGDGPMLTLRSAADADNFVMGLRSFINEAQLLASFDHPSLVKVHRFWEANGTAYMAMPYYAGRTLKEVRQGMEAPPDDAWLGGVVQHLLGALELLHAQRVYHRDISPDNIMLLPDGRPVLLDFGSARRVLGDSAQALTAILKPHFSPVEQYADMATFPQGPWTDLYALGAVVFFMLRRELPMPAALRALRDDLPMLAQHEPAAESTAESRFRAGMDWALAVHPQHRPDSVAALRKVLSGEVAAPAARRRGRATPLPAPASPDGFWPATERDVSRQTPRTEPPTAGAAANDGTRAATHRRIGAPSRFTLAIAGLTLCSVVLVAWALNQRDTGITALASPAVMTESMRPVVSEAPAPVVAPVAAPRAPEATTVSVAAARPAPPSPALAVPTIQAPNPAATSSTPKAKGPVSTASKQKTTPAAPVADVRAIGECANKNFLLRPMCLRRACEQAQLRSHPQCAQLRADDEARVQAQVNR